MRGESGSDERSGELAPEVVLGERHRPAVAGGLPVGVGRGRGDGQQWDQNRIFGVLIKV